jgi:hypothetical protein
LVKHQLGAVVAVIASISAAGAPLAANWLLSPAAPGYLAKVASSEPSTQGRPPSMEAFATDKGAVLAMAGTSPDVRDNRVLEFLRWKEKHNAMLRTPSQ